MMRPVIDTIYRIKLSGSEIAELIGCFDFLLENTEGPSTFKVLTLRKTILDQFEKKAGTSGL